VAGGAVQERDTALFPLEFEPRELAAEDHKHIFAHLLAIAKNVYIVGPIEDVDPEIALLDAIALEGEA
jgi:hypothetical protein